MRACSFFCRSHQIDLFHSGLHPTICTEGSQFEGQYYEDNYWKEYRSTNLLRCYLKFILLRKGSLDAGILFLLQRDDRRSETWMTGSFEFAYSLGPVQLLTDLQLPLAYLIHQKARLQDNQTELFEHSKKNLWQVQEPTSLRVLAVYALSS